MPFSEGSGNRSPGDVFSPVAAPPDGSFAGAGPRAHGHRGATVAAATTLAGFVLIGLAAPLLISLLGLPDPEAIDGDSLSTVFGTPSGPSAEHLAGVDGLGRDVLSRLIEGARTSLGIAAASAALSLLIGVSLGLLAGYLGGLTDLVLSRVMETFLVVPYLLLAVGIGASCSGEAGCLDGALRPGFPLVVAVIAMTSWPVVARVIRNQTLSIRAEPYVAAARVAGLGPARILVREILPNLASTVAVYAIVLVPQAILAEAALSYLGVGLSESVPSWGGMISEAAPLFPDAWWLMAFPGLAVLATVAACTVLADRWREHLR